MGAGKILSVVTKISRRQDKMEEKMKAQEKELASVKQLESRGHDSWCNQSETALPGNSRQRDFILVQETRQEEFKLAN